MVGHFTSADTSIYRTKGFLYMLSTNDGGLVIYLNYASGSCPTLWTDYGDSMAGKAVPCA